MLGDLTHPSPGHHVEENEGKNEETEHGTHDAGLTWYTASSSYAGSECGLTHESQQHHVLNRNKSARRRLRRVVPDGYSFRVI